MTWVTGSITVKKDKIIMPEIEINNIIKMAFSYTDTGYCQCHYTTKAPSGATICYCLMEESSDLVKLYRCSGGDWNEPSHSVTFIEGSAVEFELSGDEYGEGLLKTYLKGLGLDEFKPMDNCVRVQY